MKSSSLHNSTGIIDISPGEGDDLSYRSRIGKISAIQVPNLNPSLVHTYLATTLRGEVDRDSCIRVRQVEETQESLRIRHRLFARIAYLLGYHALFLSSDIVEERHCDYRNNVLGMFAIASLTRLRQRWISMGGRQLRSLSINNYHQ